MHTQVLIFQINENIEEWKNEFGNYMLSFF